jgi:hypothetical protein
MQKSFFQTIALFVLLTTTSQNAYCQAVMTTTTAPNTKDSRQNQTYIGRKGPDLPKHLDIVITINNDSLRYELFWHWYTDSYAELRQITIPINNINKNDSLVFKINEKSIHLIDKRYNIDKQLKIPKRAVSAERMRKISYAQKIAEKNGLIHFDLYEREDLRLNETSMTKIKILDTQGNDYISIIYKI